MSYLEKLDRPGPKRLLALDGGGIRGVLSIEILAKLEATLRERLGRDESFRLSDYFDYVAGTSTGAIIATLVALGKSADEIRSFYHANAPKMFRKAGLVQRFARAKFVREAIAAKMREVFGADTRFGTEDMQSLLLIVLRNASTDSPWPLSNNPRALFNAADLPDCNLNLPLWQVVRASTAAPVFFPPERVRLGSRDFVFVDGGITPFCNPAFLLFRMATLAPYNLGWKAGEKDILLVSVGTGSRPDADLGLVPESMTLWYHATKTTPAMIYATVCEQDLLCRMFGKCLVGDPIDLEVGDLLDVGTPGEQHLFTYLRYNAELTDEGFERIGVTGVDPAAVRGLDKVSAMGDLQRVGVAAAERAVDGRHFDGFD